MCMFHAIIKNKCGNHSLWEAEGGSTILIVSNILNSYCLYSQVKLCSNPIMKLHCKLGRGGVVVMNTKEKTCKKSQGNTLVTSSFSVHFCRGKWGPRCSACSPRAVLKDPAAQTGGPAQLGAPSPCTPWAIPEAGDTDRGFVYLKDCRRIQSHKNIKFIHASAHHLVPETLNKQKKSSRNYSFWF